MKLHDYQVAGISHLWAEPRSALFLDMGMGKTATVLCALTPDHLPALVVAPKRVAETTWPEERAIWRPDLSIALAVGSPAKRLMALHRASGSRSPGADITVISRENMADAIGVRPWKTLVLDELSGFKAKKTARWKKADALAQKAQYVWGMTGTPAPNGLWDLWAQIALLDGGARLGRTLEIYQERFFHVGYTHKGRPKILPNGAVYGWELNKGAEEKIHSLLADICMSLDSADHLDLPPVTRNLIKVPLPSQARRIYEDMKTELVADLELLGGGIHTAANAAVMTGKLSQIAAGFLYPDQTEPGPTVHIHEAKMDALEEVVEGTGSPILVFYRFRHELAMIRKRFPGAESIDAPDAIARWNKGQIPIMLAHPASAGHGLNLQHGGHTIVWTSLDWNMEFYKQANARLARQGQTQPVLIHHLMAAPVDRSILDSLDGKITVEQALRDALTQPI